MDNTGLLLTKTMKAIVTGGAGFLGSHLCERLITLNYEVFCIDNFLKGSPENIRIFRKNPKFHFLKYDITRRLPKKLVVDEVYHLASPASPNKNKPNSIFAHPFDTMLANTKGTWNLAEFCTNCRAKFLFASTSEVYGEPLEHPQKESYRGNVSTTGPRSIYDESKRFGETIAQAFVTYKNLDGRIIRIFNTYGPKMNLDDGRVVIEFIVTALKNKPIPIFGTGQQTRSFCYVSDMVEGIIKAMTCRGTRGAIFNLGNPQEYTILELAHTIKKLTGSKSKIVFAQPLPQDDPLRRKPDITQAKKKLKWEPKVKLEIGLSEMIEFVKQRLYAS